MWITLVDYTLPATTTGFNWIYSSIIFVFLSFNYIRRRAMVIAGQRKNTDVFLYFWNNQKLFIRLKYWQFSLVLILLTATFDLCFSKYVIFEAEYDHVELLSEIEKYEIEPCMIGIPAETFWKKGFERDRDRIINFKNGHDFTVNSSGSNTYCYDLQYFRTRLSEDLRSQFSKERVNRLKICALDKFSAVHPVSSDDKCVYKIEVEIID